MGYNGAMMLPIAPIPYIHVGTQSCGARGSDGIGWCKQCAKSTSDGERASAGYTTGPVRSVPTSTAANDIQPTACAINNFNRTGSCIESANGPRIYA